MSSDKDARVLQDCFDYHTVDAVKILLPFSVSVLKAFSIFNDRDSLLD